MLLRRWISTPVEAVDLLIRSLTSGALMAAPAAPPAPVTLDSVVPEKLSARRGDFVEITAIKVGGNDTVVALSAKDVGIAGNDIKVQIEPMYGNSYRMLADTTLPAPWSTTLKVDATPGSPSITLSDASKAKKGDHVVIDGTEYELATDPDGAGVPPWFAMPSRLACCSRSPRACSSSTEPPRRRLLSRSRVTRCSRG